MAEFETDSGTETISQDKVRAKEPTLYRVILLNDDYTTMDFVVSILEGVFRKGPAEAVQIMLSVHNNGQGICGVFSRQIAEVKQELVHRRAEGEGFPLRCVIEET